MEELNVKVGDKVLVSKGGMYNDDEFIAEVEKVTPTGMIKLSRSNCPFSFNKYGKQIGSASYFPYRLSIPTKEDYKRVEKNKLAGKILYNIRSLNTDNLYNLDTDMLKILNIALDSVGTTDEKIKEDKLNQIKSILSVSENEQQDKEAGNDDNHEKESLELC